NTLWTRPVSLPAGDGHEGMFRGSLGLSLVVAVPAGPHVYYLTATGPPDKLEKALAAVRLFRDTFRVTDAALGKARTALIARRLGYVAGDAAGARARLLLANPP